MKNTKEKELLQEQNKNERKNVKRIALILTGLIVVILAIAFGKLILNKEDKVCESHVDANLDLVCDECKIKIPCLDENSHADVNNDFLCDNCGAAIAISDVPVYKEIANEEVNGEKVNVRGEMPSDVKLETAQIEKAEALKLAKQYLDIKESEVIAGYDISLKNQKDIKYQPIDNNGNVKVTISNLNVDPSKGLAMLHIMDDGRHEMISLSRATTNEVEFITNHFSTYILVTVGTSKVEFSGLGSYNVLDENNIPLVSGVTIANNTNFKFWVMPVANYTVTNVVLKDSNGNVINPSTNGSTVFSMTDYGRGKACVISSVAKDYTVSVTNVIDLDNQIGLTAVTDGSWTTGNVVVEIDWPATSFKNQIKLNDGTWQDYSSATYTMTANGTLYARVFDGDQGGAETSITISNIDKTAPVITNVKLSTTDWTTGSVSVIFSASDDTSGIVSYVCSPHEYYANNMNYYPNVSTKITATKSIDNKTGASTSVTTTYYVRCQDAAGNMSATKTISVSKIDEREPLFGNNSSYTNAQFNLYKTYGSQKFTDATFASGLNSVGVYNNAGNGMVTRDRVTVASEGIEKCPVSSSGYVVKIQNKGNATPGIGGFVQSLNTVPDGVYIHRFYAKVPVGYTLNTANNSISGTRTWLTATTGTGEWQEYAYIWRCNSSGRFDDFGYIYLNGNVGTADNPVVWYVGYATMYDVTHIWDDVDVSYDATNAATITIRAYDYASGIKNIKVNDVEVPIDTSASTYTNGVLTTAVVNYKVSAAGTYKIVATDNAGRSSTLTRTAYSITYNPNAPAGTTVTGTTVNQIKIGSTSNARLSMDGSKYVWKVTLRNNGYTNSKGTPFRGWATSATGLPAYAAGALYQSNAGLNLYAVWNDAIQWDVSSAGNGSVIASLITNADGSTYTLKVTGNGTMKSWDWKDYSSAPWYSYRGSISHIIVENGVANVGSYAFFNITGIKDAANISLAASVKTLGTKCFGSCSSMKGTFVLPSTVTSAPFNPFQSCSLLEAIQVDPNNQYYKSIDGVMFNKSGTTLIAYPLGNGLTHYDIPEGTVTIYNEACANMKASTISIPSTLTTFNDLCFSGADLVTLSIPNTVTTLSGRPFNSLDHIEKIYYHPTNITLPHNATFTSAKAGSVIYTANKAIAGGFVDGTDYTSSRTTLAYPPYFSTHPSNVTIGEGEKTTFTAVVTDGVPKGTVTVQWQYRENSTAAWKNVTASQGTVTTSGTTTKLTTIAADLSMDGYEYRCKTGNGIYPGTVSQFTEDEIASAIISKAARLTIIEKNYSYNSAYYATIKDALAVFYNDNVSSNSARTGTITMVDSVVDESDFVINAGYKVTINTNGHTLTRTNKSIINNGRLTITGSGVITTASESAKAGIDTLIQNNGELIVNGGTIRHRGLVSTNYKAVANMTAASTTTVNSGTVLEEYGLEVAGASNGSAIYTNVASTITVNGGSILAKSSANSAAIRVETNAAAKVYIYGSGIVEATSGIGINVDSASTSTTTTAMVYADGGSIKGGTYGIRYGAKTTNTLRVNGATVWGGTSGVINYGTGETLLMSGTISSDNAGITTASNAPVNIKGGTITALIGILNNTGNSAKVTIYAGTINATNYGVHNKGTGEIRFETGKILATTYGIYNEGTGTIRVLGGTIEAGARGIRDGGSGTIIIGEKDNIITTVTPVVQGEYYGVYAEDSTIFKFYDGKLRGKTAALIDGTVDDVEDEHSVFKMKEGEYNVATLQTGWDISPEGSAVSTAWAVLEPDPNDNEKYMLTITGSGAMRNFTETSVPWLGYRHLIKTVSLQEGVTNIGTNTFYNCVALDSIEIPNTVTTIGDHAYANCTNVTGNVEIPAKVTSMGVNPFSNATVTSFTVVSSNTTFKANNGVLMNVAGNTIIAYPIGNVATSYTMPDTVSTINNEAFMNATLSDITLSTSLKTIGDKAFDGNKNIKLLVIPASVTSIGVNAFSNMSTLSECYLKSTSVTIGNNAFANMPVGSVIYTMSYDVSTKFTSSIYTTSRTTIYYPPRITVQPLDQELTCPEPGVFTVEAVNGSPTGFTYQWYIRERGSSVWRKVESSDGTGGTTNKFTTVNTENAMAGLSYRCVITGTHYPNAYMTQDELASQMVSSVATLAVTGGNYQLNGNLYYSTLEAVLEAAGAGTHTIDVMVSVEDGSTPIIDSNQNITLKMNEKEIEKIKEKIVNNGTLTIVGGGVIETDKNSNSLTNILITNNGTINLSETSLIHNGKTDAGFYAVQNYGTFNMTSGSVQAQLSTAIAANGNYACRGITNFSGIINISGGIVSANYNRNASTSTVSAGEVAYAIEAWRETSYTGKVGEINISGNANINSNCNAVVMKYDTTSETASESKINITGGTITGGYYGVWTSANTKGTVTITDATVSGANAAISLNASYPVIVTIGNTTLSSANGSGIESLSAGNTVTINEGVSIDAKVNGVDFENAGTYTQNDGYIVGGTNGVKLNTQGEKITANIKAGTVIGTSGSGISVPSTATKVSLNVSGETVTGSANGIDLNAKSTSDFTLTDAIVSTTGSNGIGVNVNSSTTTINIGKTSGGNAPSITGTATGMKITNANNCTLNSGIISGKAGIELVNTKVTLKDATIEGTDTGAKITGTSILTMDGGVIDSSSYAVKLSDSATLTMNAGDITSKNVGIETIGASTLNMNNGDIDVSIYGIVNKGSGNINVSNGTVFAGEIGISNESTFTGKLTIGVDDTNVSKLLPEIRSIEGVKTTKGFYFYDGILKGIFAAKAGEVLDHPKGYNFFEDTETIEGKTYKTFYMDRGWNISANPSVDDVWAFIEETPTGNALIIRGTGKGKDFDYVNENYDNIPWAQFRNDITEIIVRDGVTRIGDRTFAKSNQVTVSLGNTLKELGDYVFISSNNIGSTITIPKSVTSIGANPFVLCSNLKTIAVESGNANFTAINGVLYSVDGTRLISYPIGNTSTEFVIPSAVVEILDSAFRGSTTLNKVVIGKNVTLVEPKAFFEATGIKNVYVQSTALNILGAQSFVKLASGSTIYTMNKTIANKFVDNYESGAYSSTYTTIYYPPVITTQPVSQLITIGNTVKFSLGVTAGVPSSVTYVWQYRTSGTDAWKNVTTSMGSGVNSNTLTITSVPSSYNNYQFRCVVSNTAYPNTYMTNDELNLTSNAAILTLNAPNYKIGSVFYNTLKEAVDDVKTNASTTIQVNLDNTEITAVTIQSGRNIVLDLAGKTINASGIKTGAFITNNGTLELKDSSSNGKIDITQSEATSTIYVVSNSGTLNVTSGTYSIQTNKEYPAVIENQSGTTNIKGGTISSAATNALYAGWCVGVFAKAGTLNVTGGTINVTSELEAIEAVGIINQGSGTADINVSGGKVEVTGPTVYAIDLTNHMGTSGTKGTTLDVSGTTEIVANGTVRALGINNDYATSDINITGGTITATTNAIYNTASTTNIGTAGDSVSTTSPVLISENIAINSTQNVNFYDGVIKAKNIVFYVAGTLTPEAGYGVRYTNDGTYNVAILVLANYSDGTSYYATLKDAFDLAASNATITVMQNVTDASNATVPSGKTFTLNLGTNTITKTSYAITNEGTLNVQGNGTLQSAAYGTNTLTSLITNTAGTLNVKAGTIHNQGSSSKDCYAIEIADGNINVSGGTVKGTNAGAIHLASSATSAKLAVTNGTVSATGTNKSAIKNDGTSAVTIGTSGSSVSTTSPVIRGEKYGVEIVNNSAVFNFYDGNIGGKTAPVSGTIDAVPNTYVLTYDTDGDYKTVCLLEGHYLIGSTYYVTLEDAVNAISGTGTIKVTKAYTDASNPVISSGKNITIDLNGKTITKTVKPISTSGTLTITDNASTGGTIKTSTLEHLVVQNGGTFTMQKGKLTHNGLSTINQWSVVHVLSGTQTNINGGTITSENASKVMGSNGRAILIEGNTEFNMAGGTVKTSSTLGEMYPIMSWQSGGSTVINITGGTVENASGAGDAISIGYTTEVNATKLNITGGTIISKNGKGVNYSGTGKFVLGDSSNAINSLTPEFKTQDVAVASNNGFEWYDGILKSQNAEVYNATITATVPKCEPLFDTEEISGVTYYKAWLEIARNYKVGDIYYAVLGDVIEIHPNGANIQLLKDCEDDSIVEFPAGQTYTLDLETKTITKTTHPIVNNAKLTITGSGYIRTEDCNNLIENKGTLVIDNAGEFTNTKGMGINQTAGSVTISQATITANTVGLYVANGTTATFNGEMIRGKQKAIDGKATAPKDKAIYFYEDATYKYAVLKTGWNISKTTSDDVTAYVLENNPNDGMYRLVIIGTGNMKNFTAAGAPWYANYKDLIASIEIGEGVTNIGTYAFDGLSKAKTISIPTTMTAIENYALRGCSSITSLTIPKAVTSIGCSFGNMSSLNGITVVSGNTTFETDGIGLYNKNTNRLIATTNATSYAVKDGTIYIGIDAMSGRTINALTLPESLTTISENSLYNVRGLSTLIIPEAVRTIGKNAFANATALKTVYIQTSNTSYGSGSFTNLPSGSSIYVLTQAIAKKFTASVYSSANTTLKYPPKATATFGTKTVDPMKTLTLDVGVLNGVPGETIFRWQIKEPGATEWKDLTEGTGYDSAVYTTVPITLDMVGTEYRCILSSSAFPNQYMTIENAALAGELISKVATIAISNTTMNTEWAVTSSGQTLTLPISGNVNVSVDWGDGNIETITTDNPTHKYSAAGTYQIRVGGTCDMWGTNNNVATYTQMLTKVNQWGELGASKYSFAGCAKLTYVSPNISATASAAITDMANMFANCSSLTSIDLSKFDTSNVTTMESMFMNATGLTKLDLSKFKTGKVVYMQQMFYGCSGLTSLNVTNFDTTSVIAMQNMFNGCSSLKVIDLKDFNTKLVANMGGMFANTTALQVIHLGSNFDRFSGVSMFEGANALRAIIAQKTATTSAEAMTLNANAFTNASSNVILYVMNKESETAYQGATNYSASLGNNRIEPILALKGDSKVVIDMGTTYGESADEGVYVAGFDKSGKTNYTGIGYSVRIDGLPVNTEGPGTYTVTFTAVYNSTDLMSVTRTVKVVDANKLMTREAPDIVNGAEVYYAIGASRANKKTYKAELIKTITLVESPVVPADALDSWDASFYLGDEQVYAWVKKNTTNTNMYDLYLGGNEVVIAPPDSTNIFGEYPNLTSIQGLSLLDANEVTTFERLFYNDANLANIDAGIANWNVTRVTDTSYAFAGCNKITQLDLKGWKTTALTNMSNMFDGCTQLSTLNIVGFNTSKVTNFKEAFNNCSNLATLTEPNWNTASTVNMDAMFNNCAKLTTLNVKGWNVTNLQSAAGMFKGCALLTNLDVSGWATNKLTNSSEMFKDCSSLTVLDMTSWNTGVTTNMASMFENCSNVEILLLGKNVDKLDGASMFSGCNKLKKIIAERRVTNSSEAMKLSNNTGLNANSNVILYVWDKQSETAYESATNYGTVFGTNRIRTILVLKGDSYVAIRPGETYTDAGVTVMDYNDEDDSVYKSLGYTLNKTTDLDINTSGRYEVVWTLYKPSGTVVTNVVREVYVRHIPVVPTITVTQKNNGNVIESGTWASGDLLVKFSGTTYGSGEFEYIYSFDQSNWVVASEFTHTGAIASKNVYVKARGVIDNGDISKAAIFEIKVDTTTPSITAANRVGYNGVNEVYGLTIEDGTISSGMAKYAIASENNLAKATWYEYTDVEIPDDGTWYIWVQDVAGNISSSFEIVTTDQYKVEATYGGNTVKYVDILEAIEAIEANSVKTATIKLLDENNVEVINISSGYTMTMDLNGNNLNTTGIVVAGKLTLKDSSSEVHKITIDSTELELVVVRGEMIIDGNIEINSLDNPTEVSMLISVYSGAKFTMNNGTVKGLENLVAISNAGTTTILNGTVTSTSTTKPTIENVGSITLGKKDTNVSITSPRIEGNYKVIETIGELYFYDGILAANNSTVTLDGPVTTVQTGYHLIRVTNGTTNELYLDTNDTVLNGWDISETASDNVYAEIRICAGDGISDNTKYELTIAGTGKAKDFTLLADEFSSDHPWSAYRENIIKLNLEEGVTKYGKLMFYNLNGVTSVALPDSLNIIEDYAFYYMETLSGNVKLSKNIAQIGICNPFANTLITSFTVDSQNTLFEVRNNGLYNASTNRLIAYPCGSTTTKPTVADGTLIVGELAFAFNEYATDVKLPDSLKFISSGAFSNCNKLQEITIPESVDGIDSWAFDSSKNLMNVYIKSKEFATFVNANTFTNLAEGSIIYTESKEIADLFIADTTYTSSKTKVYYPFKIMEELRYQAIARDDTLTIEPEIREGYIASDVSYQWYQDGKAIAGATSPVYTKTMFTDSDEGMYKLVIKSAKQSNGEYYYTVESNEAEIVLGDFEAPESITTSVKYNEDGSATVTITANDKESGVDEIAVNGELIAITKNDKTGSAVGSFTVNQVGTFDISATDYWDNTATISTRSYEITYVANTTGYTGETAKQIKIHDFDINLRKSGSEKVGHAFTGWNTRPDGTGTTYAENAAYSGNGNVEFYGTWQILSYIVRFYNDNGINGNQIVAEGEYVYGTQITVPGLQYRTATEVGETTYRIYYHNENWRAEKVNENAKENPVNITSSNKDSIVMIDSDVNYYAEYSYIDNDINNKTVSLDGKMNVTGDEYGIYNDEGLIILGESSSSSAKPTITGSISLYNNNGIVLWYNAGFSGPRQGLVVQK